jgi:hypothetical protein
MPVNGEGNCIAQLSTASFGSKIIDYYQVDMLGSRYQSINLRVKKSPGESDWRVQIYLTECKH